MARTEVVVVCLAVVLVVVVFLVVVFFEVVGLVVVVVDVDVVGSFVKLNGHLYSSQNIYNTIYLHWGEKLTSSIAMSESPGEPTVASMTT